MPSERECEYHELSQIEVDNPSPNFIENSYNTTQVSSFFSTKSDSELRLQLEEYVNKGNTIKNIYDGRTEEESKFSLMQYCCKERFELSLDFMIANNVDVNYILPKNKKHPLLYLLEDERLFRKYFLEKRVFKPHEIPKNILVEAIRKDNHVPLLDMILTYLKCECQSMREIMLGIVNGIDIWGRTALHHAAKNSYKESFLKLVKMKSSLTLKDYKGFTPLELLEDHKILESYLNSCIDCKKSPGESEMEIVIDYKDLMTDGREITEPDDLTKMENNRNKTVVNETFFLNALLDEKLGATLSHPVVEIFIFIKWHKLRWIFWFYFLLNIAACLCNYIGIYIYHPKGEKISVILIFLCAFVLLLIVLFVELAIFGRKCWKNVQFNVTCLLTLSLICHSLHFAFAYSGALITLSSTTFFTTIKIFLTLQVNPMFTLNVILLRRTSLNFFKIMSFYLLPILAFALCFHLLDENSSKTFPLTIFETIIAFSGNVGVGDIEKFESNPVFGRILYILFVFIVVIILNNLLSALAINDLTRIYKDASFIEKKEITKYLITFEKILWNNSFIPNPLLCVTPQKLFTNNNYKIHIYPSNKVENIQIADNDKEYFDLKRPVKSLINFLTNGAMLQNHEKNCVHCKYFSKLEEELKDVKHLLNSLQRH